MDIKSIFSKLDKYDYLAIGIFIVAIALRLAFSGHCLWVDEARDLDIARTFSQTGKQLFFGQPYLWHPIMEYIMLSISTSILGVTIFGGAVVPILLGSLTVLLAYLIGKEAYNKKAGILAALLMLIQPLHWFYSDRVLNDVPDAFFFTLSIYMFLKFIKTKENKFLYLTGLTTVLAALTRISSLILIPIFGVYILLNKDVRNSVMNRFLPKRNILLTLGIFIGIFALSLFYNYLTLGTPINLSLYMGYVFTATLDAAPWWYYLASLPFFLKIELTALFIWGVIASLLNKSKSTVLFLIVFALFFIEISMVNVKVDRYIMPIVPITAIFGGYGLAALTATLKKYSKYLAYAVLFVILAWTLFSFYADGSSMISGKASGFCGLDQIGLWINQNVPPNETVIAGSATIIGFYADRNNLIEIPANQSIVEDMFKNGSARFLEVDLWERTQPQFIFTYVTNNSHLRPVNASLIDGKPVSIVYMYINETNNNKTLI